MTRSKLEKELHTALAAVQSASRVCSSVQAKITPEVLEKEDRSPVTVADFASQAAICRAIGDAFPNDPIIGEEESGALRRDENAPFLARVLAELEAIGIKSCGPEVCAWIDRGCEKTYSERFWTLDPIDGTKGFVRKEQYAVALALLVGGKIEIAVLGCPNLPWSNLPGSNLPGSNLPGSNLPGSNLPGSNLPGSNLPGSNSPGGEAGASSTIFYAVRGGGSWCVPLDGRESARPIRASQLADAANARFCESVESSHTAQGLSAKVADALGMTRPPLRMDGQVKYAVVARGDAEIYMRLPAKLGYKEKIWDHAGGVLVVEEAGGRVSDVMGKALEFNHGYQLLANRGVVAANGELHPRVIAALEAIYAKFPPPQEGPAPPAR